MRKALQFLAGIVRILRPGLSQELIQVIDSAIDKIKEAAAKTPNEFDDVMAEILDDIFPEPE